MLSVDLNEVEGADAIGTDLRVSREAVRPGRLGGVCVFFRVTFDDDVRFETAPDHPRTHWGNRLFRTPRREYEAGETIVYDVEFGTLTDTDTWSVTLDRDGSRP